MKIIFVFVFVVLIFFPSSAFGWKSIASLYEKECVIDCNYGHASIDSSKPMNFILLGIGSLIGFGLYLKSTRLKKYETFSIKCERCGRATQGLKCIYCEAQKQKAR